jgi:predicted DNA-binding protein
MPGNQMLTVRIPTEVLEKLDQLAALQGRPRSQLVQEALTELINNNANLRSLELARLKTQLRPAIKEQCAFLDEHSSFADANRSF